MTWRRPSLSLSSAQAPTAAAGRGRLAWALLSWAVLVSGPGRGADWPAWQHDAGRSAATDEALPESLQPQWVVRLPALAPCWDDPVNQDRMPYDSAYEPVVAGTVLVFASNRDDSVTALDTRTGRTLWQAITDGPVRLPPAIAGDRVLAASDDGYLYAFALADGRQLWRVRGGRDDRHVLGNGRLISPWCARGGPVVLDGTVYFGAGIWPFMATYTRAVDARTGTPVWTQDQAGDLYLNQPHSGAESFSGLAPQGALAAAGDCLVVPNGRALPAVLNRGDGSVRHFHLAGSVVQGLTDAADRKLEGGSYVCTDGHYLVNRRGVATCLYDLESGRSFLAWKGTYQPVLSGGVLYLGGDKLRAYRLDALTLITETVAAAKTTSDDDEAKTTKTTTTTTAAAKTTTRKRWDLPAAWELPVAAHGALIKAGDRLYAAAGNQVQTIGPTQGGEPRVLRSVTVDGTVARLLAADQRLFAVTQEGMIACFGADLAPVGGPAVLASPAPTPAPTVAADHPYRQLATSVALPAGWAVLFGARDTTDVEALLARDGLRAVAVAESAERVAALRRALRERGLYGTRATVHLGTPADFRLPSCLSLLTVVRDVPATADPAWLAALHESVRPYGGQLRLEGDPQRLARLVADARLPGAEVVPAADAVLVRRQGPLPGAADWTHLYGDVANRAKSDDQLVRAPLGLLWFGGVGHQDVLPRHGHGPGELVVGGRLFVQGIDVVSARDVYTGTVLWRHRVGNLGTAGVYYDTTYRADPLDLTYNQRHIPGANARGGNLVATPDRLYLAAGRECLVLDPADGRTLATFAVPPLAGAAEAPEWGYLGVTGDVLVAGTGTAAFSQVFGVDRGVLWEDYDTSSSRGLAGLDRVSGRVLWQHPARLAFRHNAICAGGGTLFCIDALPAAVADRLKRRDRTPDGPATLYALDVRTGAVRWQRTTEVFGTALSFAPGRDLLVQAGRASRDALRDETADRIQVLHAADGTPVWDRRYAKAVGPCILHGDTVYTSAVSTTGGALSLLTGEPILRPHPLTGEPQPWTYHRRYGCNSVVASQHLLTFRSGAAGFLDLDADAGTANLGGFKSGCTSNLIAADGVLNAPDFTRTCTCAYQNQTSLALVHMPDIDVWSASPVDRGNGRIRDLAVNLGAPGDRRETDGPIWFEFPIVGGPSPKLPVLVEGQGLTWFRHRPSDFAGDLAWVAASGVAGEATVTVEIVPADPGVRTVNVALADPADDAEEDEGQMIHGSSDLELVRDKHEQTVGVRFAHVPLAAADPLTSAHLQFTADEATTEATEVVIRAEAHDDAPALGKAAGDLGNRAQTQAEVRWTIPAWSTAGAAADAQRSPDLAPLLREIVKRPGWRPGQAMTFLVRGQGRRVARSGDSKSGGGPRLDLVVPLPPVPIPAEGFGYRLRLVLAEPDAVPRERVFDVVVQGQVVCRGVRFAESARRAVVREVPGLRLRDRLTVQLRANPGSAAPPVLCGLHLHAEP